MAGSTDERLSALKSVLAAVSKLPEADARHLLRFIVSRHGKAASGVADEYSKEISDRADAEQRDKLRREKVLADAKELGVDVSAFVSGVSAKGSAN